MTQLGAQNVNAAALFVVGLMLAPLWLDRWRVRIAGRRHARVGVKQRASTLQRLAPRAREFDPAHHPEEAQLAASLNNQGRVVDARAETDRLTREVAAHSFLSIPLFGGGLVLAGMTEMLAQVLLMAQLGIENPPRTLLGIGSAALLLVLTDLATRRSVSHPSGTGAAAVSRPAWWYLVVAAYGLVVVATTVIRVTNVAVESEESTVAIIATGVLLLSTTVGPAFLAEYCMRRLTPISRTRRQLRIARSELHGLIREQERARRQVTAIHARNERASDRQAILEAVYDDAHGYETASLATRRTK